MSTANGINSKHQAIHRHSLRRNVHIYGHIHSFLKPSENN